MPGVYAAVGRSTSTSIQVNGKPVNQMTDEINGVEARILREVYKPEWLAAARTRCSIAAAG